MASHKFKFGRKTRGFNMGIPHLSAVRFKLAQPAISFPPSQDFTPGASDFGMMLNNELGDCTCAAYYHARQVWTFNSAGAMQTEPDPDVETLYEAVGGYDPNAPLSPDGSNPADQGANEQNVLHYLLTVGAPIGPTGVARDKILAFIEVDPRNENDLKATIYEFGLAYIGFVVPQSWTNNPPPAVWDKIPGDG